MHKFVGAVCNLRTNGLRDTVMSRLRRLNCLCSSKESGTAYRFRHGSTLCSPTVEKILCRSPFRSGRRSLVCVRLSNKGKVGVQRGRETAGVPSFLPPPRVRRPPRGVSALPAEVQRKTLRPDRVNPPAAVRVPQSAGAEKRLPPGRGEPACKTDTQTQTGAVFSRFRYSSTFSSSFCT